MGDESARWPTPRISDRLRRLVIEETEKELAGFDVEAIRSAEPPIEQMSEAEQLADVERYGVVLLLDELQLPVGMKNRNRGVIRLACNLAGIRYERVQRGHRRRKQLDDIIEDLAMS